jgi:hypothetical protein
MEVKITGLFAGRNCTRSLYFICKREVKLDWIGRSNGSFEENSLLIVMLCNPVKFTDVSEERTASVVRVEVMLSK